ncbi:hypothetical protein [Nocardioides sp. LHG3406-4]|uniref:hypothetical protein n=1 Tax=Nocardioides sp. LHG3406-4 TaxID=2804575 RepID=UPI003CF53683
MSTPPSTTSAVEATPRLSMDDLMKSDEIGLPRATHDLCFAGKLTDAYMAATERFVELEQEVAQLEDREQRRRSQAEDGNGTGRRRMTSKGSPELAAKRQAAQEAAEEADAIRERMLKHTKTVLLVAKQDHEWASFCEKNPPREREEDPTGYTRDLRMGNLTCNIDVLAQCGDWITQYDDEPAKPEHWQKALEVTAFGDRCAMASKIIGLQTQTVDLGKSRRDWLATRRSASSSK